MCEKQFWRPTAILNTLQTPWKEPYEIATKTNPRSAHGSSPLVSKRVENRMIGFLKDLAVFMEWYFLNPSVHVQWTYFKIQAVAVFLVGTYYEQILVTGDENIVW